MDYEKTAEILTNKIVPRENGKVKPAVSEITIDTKMAIDLIIGLKRLARIKKIMESEHGGAEFYY